MFEYQLLFNVFVQLPCSAHGRLGSRSSRALRHSQFGPRSLVLMVIGLLRRLPVARFSRSVAAAPIDRLGRSGVCWPIEVQQPLRIFGRPLLFGVRQPLCSTLRVIGHPTLQILGSWVPPALRHSGNSCSLAGAQRPPVLDQHCARLFFGSRPASILGALRRAATASFGAFRRQCSGAQPLRRSASNIAPERSDPQPFWRISQTGTRRI